MPSTAYEDRLARTRSERMYFLPLYAMKKNVSSMHANVFGKKAKLSQCLISKFNTKFCCIKVVIGVHRDAEEECGASAEPLSFFVRCPLDEPQKHGRPQ